MAGKAALFQAGLALIFVLFFFFISAPFVVGDSVTTFTPPLPSHKTVWLTPILPRLVGTEEPWGTVKSFSEQRRERETR